MQKCTKNELSFEMHFIKVNEQKKMKKIIEEIFERCLNTEKNKKIQVFWNMNKKKKTDPRKRIRSIEKKEKIKNKNDKKLW